jgi:hypothetical protein
MLRERKIWYRRAAEEPVIHADRSELQRSNSQTADKAALRSSCYCWCRNALHLRRGSPDKTADFTEVASRMIKISPS